MCCLVMSAVGRDPLVTDDELVAAMRSCDCPVVTTGDLVDHVDMTKDGVRRRLNQLIERGKVSRKQVGARAVVYWPSEG